MNAKHPTNAQSCLIQILNIFPVKYRHQMESFMFYSSYAYYFNIIILSVYFLKLLKLGYYIDF